MTWMRRRTVIPSGLEVSIFSVMSLDLSVIGSSCSEGDASCCQLEAIVSVRAMNYIRRIISLMFNDEGTVTNPSSLYACPSHRVAPAEPAGNLVGGMYDMDLPTSTKQLIIIPGLHRESFNEIS